MKITNKEYLQIVDEVTARILDLRNMPYFREKVTKQLMKAKLEDALNNPEDTLRITHNIDFIGNDLIQILGRIRRKGR